MEGIGDELGNLLATEHGHLDHCFEGEMKVKLYERDAFEVYETCKSENLRGICFKNVEISHY